MAAKYWVGGTGNLDGSDTTHISDTDGGAGGAVYPAAGDDLIFNANSGGGTVTVTAAVGMKSITCGAFTGSFVGNSQTLTLQTFNGSGSGTRTINIDNTTINLSGDNAWTLSTVTNLTFSATGSTINLTGGGAFQGGGKTYGTVNITYNFVFTLNSMSCVDLTYSAGAVKTANLSIASNIICSGTFSSTGNSAINRVLVSSNTVGTARTITAAAVSVDKTDFMDITGAGAATWDMSAAAGYTGDCGGNTMQALGAAAFTTAADQTATGTSSFTWSTHGWTSRVPLPQDNVIINNSFSASQTITADMPRLGRSITCTCTGSPVMNFSVAATNFGDFILATGMTISGNVGFTLAGRGTYSFTSLGLAFGGTGAFTISAPTGTYTLNDNLVLTADFVNTYGSITGDNKTITAKSFNFSNTSARTFSPGTTTYTITGTSSNVWNMASSGITANTSGLTVVISTTSASTRTFIGGGKSYAALTHTVAGSTGQLNITGSNTFGAINFSDATNARSLAFTAATTTTIGTLNGFNVNGTAGKLMTVTSITGATHTLTSVYAQTCTYITPTYSIVDSSPVWRAGTTSTNGGNNTNWVFTDASWNIFGDEGMVS